MSETSDRRPLKSRGTKWAGYLTGVLARTSITPNQISMASMVFAAIAGGALFAAAKTSGLSHAACLIAAAACCQLRLVCNLLDGMVAVEAGKSAPDGAFWNEFPDRVSDIFILVGAGFCALAAPLGWAAACFAVLTAYVRELGQKCGAPADYRGPMAKPQRMAVVTVAAIIAVALSVFYMEGKTPEVMAIALWVIIFGAVITTIRRARSLIAHLHQVVR